MANIVRASNGRFYNTDKSGSIEQIEKTILDNKLMSINRNRIYIKLDYNKKDVKETKIIEGKKRKVTIKKNIVKTTYVDSRGKKVNKAKYEKQLKELSKLSEKINPSNFQNINKVFNSEQLTFLNFSILSEIHELKNEGYQIYYKGKLIDKDNYIDIINKIRKEINSSSPKNKKKKKGVEDYPNFIVYYDIKLKRAFIFQTKKESDNEL